MADLLQPDAQQAIAFLLWLNPEAPLYLEAHESAGGAKPKTKECPAHAAEAVAQRFVAANNSDELRRNLYFVPNAELMSGGRAKANVSASRFLWVDLDCKDYPGTETEQSDRILGLLSEDKLRPRGVPRPTAFWFTGGGYQAIWRMTEPVSVEDAEAQNRALLVAFQGGPGTFDAGRLLRLPGTVNWLSDRKRAAGREPANALLLDPVPLGATPVSYSLSDFRLRLDKSGGLPTQAQGRAVVDVEGIQPLPLPDDLGEVVPLDPVWAEVIVTGRNPPDKNYPSRSELVFAVTVWLVANDVQPGHVVSILISADHGIGAHVREQPNPLRYAKRQVARAMEAVAVKDKGWPKVSQYGHPISHAPENVRFALATLGIDVKRNLFEQTDEIIGHNFDTRDAGDISEMLCSIFQRELHFNCNVAAIRRELLTLAHERAYHPVIDYLDGLVWDGVPRLDTWLRDYCEADDTELNREFGAKFLIAGVRRIKEPGVKFDTMLVLEGRQGVGKSRLAARLAVRREWFCGSLNLNADAKTKAELVARAWIVECQELDGARKATLDAIKSFLATQHDVYRPAYARNAASYPRHCVIIGTTNEDAYLRDQSGNRRYWPVRVGSIDIDRFGEDVDQLWAEAAMREQAGELIVLSPHLREAANALQSSRMIEDPIGTVLEDEFGGRTGRVSMESVKFLLGYEAGRMSAGESQRIHGAMTALGWDYGVHRLQNLGRSERSPRKGFARGTSNEQKTEWIAKRGEGGIPILVLADGSNADGDSPF